MVFFCYTTMCTILFLSIAVKWPRMMTQWASVEERFLCPPYRYHFLKLSLKIKLIAFAVIALAFFEHLLYLINSVYNYYQHVVTRNITVFEFLEYFLRKQMGFVYNYIPFSVPFGILNEVMNTTFTFGWNYMELFVMMISLGLSTRFKQINAVLRTFRGEVGC